MTTDQYNFTSSGKPQIFNSTILTSVTLNKTKKKDVKIKVEKIEMLPTKNDFFIYLNYNEYQSNTYSNFTYYIKLLLEYTDHKKSESVYELTENQTTNTISLVNQDHIIRADLFVCFRTKRQNEICAYQNEFQTKRNI